MDNVTVFNTQPASVPYDLVVDRYGILTHREVREESLKRDRRPQFRKEDQLSRPDTESPSVAQRENLKKDAIFKMLLNDQKYAEEVAVPFLRAFWGHLTEVSDLQLKTGTLQGNTKDSRNVCPDTVWQSQKTGDVFLIEMQRRRQDFYNQRIALYDGKLRATLAEKGSDWDFNQVSVFVLGMADFDLERPAGDNYIYTYVNMNPENNKDLLTGRDWKMLADLKKARKIKQVSFTQRDKWIYLLNNFHKLKRIPAFLKEGYFDQVIKIAKNLNRTKMEELMDFFWENYQKDLAREAEAIGEARGKAKGRAQGRAQGRAEGIAQGKAEGIAEGEVRGKAEGIIEAIRNFISNRPKGNKVTASAIAALFGIDEGLAHSILSA